MGNQGLPEPLSDSVAFGECVIRGDFLILPVLDGREVFPFSDSSLPEPAVHPGNVSAKGCLEGLAVVEQHCIPSWAFGSKAEALLQVFPGTPHAQDHLQALKEKAERLCQGIVPPSTGSEVMQRRAFHGHEWLWVGAMGGIQPPTTLSSFTVLD